MGKDYHYSGTPLCWTPLNQELARGGVARRGLGVLVLLLLAPVHPPEHLPLFPSFHAQEGEFITSDTKLLQK